jgi:hypothetical protein
MKTIRGDLHLKLKKEEEHKMCCLPLALFFLGPRITLILLWLFPTGRHLFDLAFNSFIVPVLGIIFLPWTTLAWVIFSGNNGVAGFDWVWVILGLVVDIAVYSGSVFKRKSVPGYPQSAP